MVKKRWKIYSAISKVKNYSKIMPKEKKILILGVTGQDGSFMAKFLLKKTLLFMV